MTRRGANSRGLGIAICLVGLLASQPSLASPKCGDTTVSERLKSSTAVFTGEALEVRPIEHLLEIRFKISEAFKGTANATEIRVFTYPISMETPNFEPGHTYLVFAHKSEGKLMASGCAGTVKISHAKQEISKLRKLTRNRNR